MPFKCNLQRYSAEFRPGCGTTMQVSEAQFEMKGEYVAKKRG